MCLLYGDDIDNRLNWPLGRANRLAKRGKLPHVVLPDGSIRFEWEAIEPLIVRVPHEPCLVSRDDGEGHR
jgi:hypothetical protein